MGEWPVHASAEENLSFCLDLIAAAQGLRPTSVLHVVHEMSTTTSPHGWRIVDFEDLPFVAKRYDAVLATDLPTPAEFMELTDACKDPGYVVLVCPAGAQANASRDAYAELAQDSGRQLLFFKQDERGPQRDAVAIFGRDPIEPDLRPMRQRQASPPAIRADNPQAESASGGMTHLEVLDLAHDILRPALYLEIGVHRGSSLRLARCRAVGIDPDPRVMSPTPNAVVHQSTSDDFFRYESDTALCGGVDLAFVDGMHLFEFALRDFMNVERNAAPGAVVLVDDVLPNHIVQAKRQRTSIAWAGDVWKLHHCLRQHRPDLSLQLIDSSPTGLLLVSNLDSSNRRLWDQYNDIVEQYISPTLEEPPQEVLQRSRVVARERPQVAQLLASLRGPHQATIGRAPRS